MKARLKPRPRNKKRIYEHRNRSLNYANWYQIGISVILLWMFISVGKLCKTLTPCKQP